MLEILLLVLVGFGAGMINAVAGGGNLLVLPAFLGLGLSPFTAVITAAVTVTPASLASAYGYRKDLRKLPRRYFLLLIPCLLGAAIGLSLLHSTPSNVFDKLLPWLVMATVALYIFQPELHKRLRKPAHLRYLRPAYLVALALFLACIYGGYFTAGIGFLILALLGFLRIRNIFQMTGLKAVITGSLGLMTIITFSVTGELAWHYGLLAAAGSVWGGYLGARLSHRISPHLVRLVIAGIGTAVIAMTFTRAYL